MNRSPKTGRLAAKDALGAPLLTVLRIALRPTGAAGGYLYRADRSRSDMEREMVLHCHSGGSVR